MYRNRAPAYDVRPQSIFSNTFIDVQQFPNRDFNVLSGKETIVIISYYKGVAIVFIDEQKARAIR